MSDLLLSRYFYASEDRYAKDSIICLIMQFNPLLDYKILEGLSYEELETLREKERVGYNARLESNEKVLEKIKKGKR